MEIKKLCIKYDLEDPIHYVQNHLSKTKWKSMITSAIYKYWSLEILPNIVKTLVCISASRGNSPEIIYTAGSATFIVRDNNCFKSFL
jgi:hypothetical protein